MIDYAAPVNYPETEQWSRMLASIAEQPLALSPEFPRIAARHEAWWHCELEGPPLFLGAANPDPSRPITRNLHLLATPEAWHAAHLEQARRLHYVGDTLPNVRVDFGPNMLAKLFGAQVSFVSDTTWVHRFINDDWSNAPDWSINEQDEWWLLLPKLFDLAASGAPGQYLVCTPNLGSSGDLLLNMRGSAQLAMDVLDQPETVRSAIEGIYPSWRRLFGRLQELTLPKRAGLIQWVGLWSNRPYVATECDFNYLIGPRHFQQLFLPDVARQAAAVGRTIFHLDGPNATRHIDALLDTPEIQAIQYVPGAGNSALAKLDMLKKIQSRGRPIQVVTPAEEVIRLCDALRPEGLAILLGDSLPPNDLDDLYRAVNNRYSK